MKVAVFSSKPHDREFLGAAAGGRGHELVFYDAHLAAETASLADGFDAVCPFVNDTVDSEVIARLAKGGVRLLALRSAGYNHVDLAAAAEHGMTVMRVPAYSPHSVAEHSVALMLALNRRIHRAHARVREGNFALDGLLGFDMAGKTVGIVGTGKIGVAVARILAGFGCELLGYDVQQNEEAIAAGVRYVELADLLASSDVITLHAPLTPDTHHLIDGAALAQMKDGVMIVNTSRGALVDTAEVIEGLKSGKVGYLGLDVYEEEGDLFFEDLSNVVITDDVFSRLLTFPNVVVTGHQAFFTREAVRAIAETTIDNLDAFAADRESGTELRP